MDLVRKLQRHRAEPQRFLASPVGHPLWREPLHHQSTRVRPGDLEDVEVRVEIDADGTEGGDRLVQQQEARGQPQVHRIDQLEGFADHLQRVDLGEAGPVVPVVDLAQLREELFLPLLRIAHAEVGKAAWQGVDVLRGSIDEHARQLRDVVIGQLADGTEVDETDLVAVAQHEHVGRMRIAVEEPVTEDHRHPGLRHQISDGASLLERPTLRIQIGHLDPVEPLERQNPGARIGPEDPRHANVRMAGEVAVECVRVPRLEPVVELLPDRARELVDKLLRVDEVEGTHSFLGYAGRLIEQRDVGLDLSRRARTLHLDGDLPPVRQRGAMHLSDRGGGDRRLVELREELGDREAEILLDHLLDICDRKRPDVVLQAAQLRDDVGRKDVGPRRQQLAELDEGRAKLVEHLAQMLAALRRLPVDLDPGAASREEVGQPVSLEPVAEAVPHGDLSDLR